METLNHNEAEVVRLLYDTAKTFIPVVVGYVFAFCGAMGFLWKESKGLAQGGVLRLAQLTILLGVCSVGIWSGTIPFCIRIYAFNDYSLVNNAQLCAQIGHILFFTSVASGALTAILFLKKHNKSTQL